MQTWKINIELKVSDNWVSDGVNFTDKDYFESFLEHIREFIPYAYYDIEFKVKGKVTKSPTNEKINEL